MEARKNARKRWHISRIIPICMNIWLGFLISTFIADIYEVPTDVRTERIEKIADAFEIKEALGI